MLRLLHCTFAGLLAFLLAQSFAWAETEEEYRAEVAQWVSLLHTAPHQTRQDAAKNLQWVSEQALRPRTVTRPDGSEVQVDNLAFAQAAQNAANALGGGASGAAQIREAARIAEQLLGQLQEPPPPEPSANDPHQIANQVLSRKEFGAAASGGNWLYRMLRRLSDWLAEHVRFPSVPGVTGQILSWVAYFIIYAAAVGCVLLLVWAFRRRRARGREPAAAAQVVRQQARPSSESLRRQAAAALRAGNLREALRLMYLALLTLCAERGLVDWADDKTNWEYVRELQLEPVRVAMQECTRVFENRFFGGHPPTSADFGLLESAAETTEGSRRRTGQTAASDRSMSD